MTLMSQLVRIITNVKCFYKVTPRKNTVKASLLQINKLFSGRPFRVTRYGHQFLFIAGRAAKNIVNCSLQEKAQILDSIMRIVKEFPNWAKRSTLRVTNIFRLMMDILCSFSSETTDQWMNPPDGYIEDKKLDLEQQTLKKIYQHVRTFISAITFDVAVENLKPLFLSYIQNTQDWRSPYAALQVALSMAAKQSNIDALDWIVQHAIGLGEHSHPKIRVASLKLMRSFNWVLESKFSQAYYDQMVRLSIKLLKDPVPKVVAQNLMSISVFVMFCESYWKLENVLGQFINPIFSYIKNGCLSVKQEAMYTLNMFAEKQTTLEPYLPSIFELAAEIIPNCVDNPRYKRLLYVTLFLKGFIFYYYTKLAASQLPQYITELLNSKDSLNQYDFIIFWYFISSVFQEFTELSQIYPTIFEMVKKKFVHIKNVNKQDTQTLKEYCYVLGSLRMLLKNNKSKAAPYVSSTARFAKNVFETVCFQTIKKEAITLYVTSSTVVKPQQPRALKSWLSQALKKYDYIMHNLYTRLTQIDDLFDEIVFLLEAAEELSMSFQSCLTDDQRVRFIQYILTLAREIKKIYRTYNLGKIQQIQQNLTDANNKDISTLRRRKHTVDQAQDMLVNVLRQLMKQVQEPTTKRTFLQIYEKDIKKYIRKTKEKRPLVSFGLRFAAAIIECLPYTDIRTDYVTFVRLFDQFVRSPFPRIRTSAILGFKNIFLKYPGEQAPEKIVNNFLKVIKEASQREFPPDPHQIDYQYYTLCCGEVSMSALAILLKQYNSFHPTLLNVEVYDFWRMRCSLNLNEEGSLQKEMFFEVVQKNPGLLVQSADNLIGVLDVYIHFMKYRGGTNQKVRTNYRQMIERIKNSLLTIYEWPLYKQQKQYIWESLTEDERKTLLSLIPSA